MTDQLTPDIGEADGTTLDNVQAAPIDKKRTREFRQRIESCKTYRRKLVKDWAINVDFRRGKPFASQTDNDRVAVNMDWSLTKQKQASLFSQVPAVRVNHPPQTISEEVAGWLHQFEQRINDNLLTAGIETAMDECLPDCINAAGIGVILVSHEALTEMVEVPAFDITMLPPDLAVMVKQTGKMPDGSPIPMETVPRVSDHRYLVSRISPADFLWPITFTGSDFDNSPWIGRSGRLTWAEAQQRWGLDEASKHKYLGLDRAISDTISNDTDKETENGDEFVSFDEIFFKEYQYTPNTKNYSTIHHMVFINGKDDPVIDEPWKGQQFDEESDQLIGAQRYPIRVLSLSYITDDAIPPSDSAIGRPQVNEINKGRTQMIIQREHSLPLRTVDINRIDPTVLYNIMKGTWQGMIPVQGNGQNVISEVSRSSFPQENFMFDKIAKMDFAELAGLGQDTVGADVETAGESDNIQTNYNTRISRERAKVGKFFTSVAEVLGGLICIYEDPSSIGEGFTPQVSKTLNYSILADSTVLLDSNQRLQRLMQFINFTAKSGWVNIEPVLREIATLSGLDPAVVIQPPQPKAPVEPNISLRLTGTEDMMNPLTLGFLIKAGQAPDAETIQKAKKLIEAAVMPPPNAQPMLGPNGQLLPAGATPALGPDGLPMPPDPNAPPLDIPQPPAPGVGEANTGWGALDRVNQRVVDRGSKQ